MIVILDFGSQYTQLIARKIRKFKVYSVVIPCYESLESIKSYQPEAIILSGGPASIYNKRAPKYDSEVFQLGIPILGICYGMQLIAQQLGGKVINEGSSEYGASELTLKNESLLFKGVPKTSRVWMSHRDRVSEIPENFQVVAESSHCISAIEDTESKLFGIQFHPEVAHSEYGEKLIDNFLSIAGLKRDWSMGSFIDQSVQEIQEQVGDKKVTLALSGGVDSSVLALLLQKAVGDNLQCIFVDNGLLRMREVSKVSQLFRDNFQINLKVIDARKVFLKKLRLIKNPESKRKIIGKLFLKILLKYSKGYHFLAQGTLYPDVIESVSFAGPSETIKTHHNRVKPILKLMKKNRIIEPFKTLFKDEVREIGKQLGLPEEIIQRQPFPGPGLAVRILGRVTAKRLRILRQADHIFLEEIKRLNRYHEFWQSFAVLLPVRSVGVMGDSRHYGYTIVLRGVTSVDGMTADYKILPKPELTQIVNRIIGEISEVTRVAWDISSKPPATIEWE